jgi:L-asparaginase
MMAYPDMVHGPGGFDSELMRVGQGRILSKRGAEGLQVIGLLPGVAGEKGVGIALKVTDGDSAYRVRPAVTVQLLQKLGALDASQCARLAKFGPELTLRNWRGIPTGPARAVARL